MTTEQIQKNYEEHLAIIDKVLKPERAAKVKAMIKDLGEENYALMPASSKSWFHGAYPGGYLAHVNSVTKLAVKIMKLYESQGGILNFTLEELVFAALFHDLGKIGDTGKPGYISQDNDWRKKNLQEIYLPNPELDFMVIPDRSLYLLQKYEIPITHNEYMAIKLHDGLFEETNKPYYQTFTETARMRSNIVCILHTADFLSSRIEFDIEHKAE